MRKQNEIPLTIPMLVFGIGILCTIAGVLRGEAQTVMEKAVRICMECIGIG